MARPEAHARKVVAAVAKKAAPPKPQCTGRGEGASQDAALAKVARAQFQALADNRWGALRAHLPKAPDVERRMAITRAVAPGVAQPEGSAEEIAQRWRRNLKVSFGRARGAGDALGLDWPAAAVEESWAGEQCKRGVREGGVKLTLKAGSTRYTLWIEDLVHTPRGWLAGTFKAPVTKPPKK